MRLNSPRSVLLLFAAVLAFAGGAPAQPPMEGSFGRGPVPSVVKMTGETRPVSLIVRPLILLARRTDLRVEVRVPRDPSNRILAIAWSSDTGTAGATQRPLDGDNAEVLHTLNLPAQPPANYLFVATVFNTLGKPRGRDQVRVVTPEEE